MKQLLEDTLLFLQTDKDNQLIDFDVSIDENLKNKVIIKAGQLKTTKDNKHLIEGVGRKIILDYKSETNSNHEDSIIGFVEKQCYIVEG